MMEKCYEVFENEKNKNKNTKRDTPYKIEFISIN